MRRTMLAAAGASLFALLAFLTLHAIVIVPIWWSAARGVPFVLIPSLAIAPAFHLLVLKRWHSALFGAGLWLCIVPPALLKDVVHIDAVIVAASTLTGALLGFAFRPRDWRGAAAGGLAGAAILVASAGPLSIFRSARALRLFAGLLPVCVAYGIAISLIATAFSSESLRHLSTSARSFFSRRERRSHSSAR